MLNRELEDDFFGGGDDDEFIDSKETATLSKVSKVLENDGYRIGKEIEENKLLQLGFNEGFSVGAKFGKSMGDLYAKCRYEHFLWTTSETHEAIDISEMNAILLQIERMLFIDMPCVLKEVTAVCDSESVSLSLDNLSTSSCKILIDKIIDLAKQLSSSVAIELACSAFRISYLDLIR